MRLNYCASQADFVDALYGRIVEAGTHAVAHQVFRDMGIDKVRRLAKPEHVLFDIKYVFHADDVDGRL